MHIHLRIKRCIPPYAASRLQRWKIIATGRAFDDKICGANYTEQEEGLFCLSNKQLEDEESYRFRGQG